MTDRNLRNYLEFWSNSTISTHLVGMLLLFMMMMVAFLDSTTGDYVCSNGVLATKCGTRYCPPEESYCDVSTCRCVTGFGQNEILCSSQDDLYASALSDPVVWSYQRREKGHLPVPCMYLFSHLRTEVSSGGQCEIWVNLYNERQDGKMFVAGYEVKIQTSGIASGDKTLVFKVDAKAQDGTYCFDMSVSLNGGPYEKSFRDNTALRIDDTAFTFDVLQSTNRVRLQVPTCGLNTNFRPADRAFTVFKQSWLPGFAMNVDSDRSPTFHSLDQVVSLTPGVYFKDNAAPGRDLTDDLIYRAFTSDANAITRIPNYSPRCNTVRHALLDCPSEASTTKALTKCRWIIGQSPFVDCWSNNVIDEFNEWPDPYGKVNRVLELYRKCVTTLCQSTTQLCDDFRSLLLSMPAKCKAWTPSDVMNAPCG